MNDKQKYIKLKDRLQDESFYTDKIFKVVDIFNQKPHGECYRIDGRIYFDYDDHYYDYIPINWAQLIDLKEVRKRKLDKLV